MIRSLRARLWAALLLPGLLLALAGAWAFSSVSRMMVDELGESLSRIAATTASQLSPAQLLTLQPGDEQIPTRTFSHLARQLRDVQRASGARRVYAVDARGRVLVDTDRLPIGAALPDLALDRLELSRVAQGARAWSKFPFVGADGTPYERGYAPLLGDDGKVFGAVGVEASAGFFAPLSRLSRRGLWLLALSLLGLFGLGFTLARALTRPLDRLVGSAERIARGDLETPIAREPTQELGTLARGLEAMREALAARDRQLSMMLAGVAHEVRNPIGGIQLFTGLLEESLSEATLTQGAQGEARAYVARIASELAYLDRVVGDFLAFARQQKLSRAPLAMDSLLESARQMLAPQASARGVALTLTCAPGRVEADADLLMAAVVNLLKNAIQAAPEGSAVRVLGEEDGGLYRATVIDRGPGVSEADPERIFEPFFTTREKGTGLGLPLARKIVQAHGGALGYRRVEGETRFEISLPRA